MSTNEPTIIVNHDTTLDEIIRQLDELGLLKRPKEIVREYRWYYNELGHITSTCTTPEDAEMYGFTGKYIIVDETMFSDWIKYEIVNDKPRLIRHDNGQRRQLEKSETGFAVVKNNAALLLEDDDTFEDKEHYDYRNN